MSKRILAAMMALVMIFSCMPVFQVHATEIAPTASGTTYYVSSLHGAEGNDGLSESAPFASLLEINEITLGPGDRVLLERGSVFVDEYLWVQGSGSAEAPIIIDVYGDEDQPKPLIQTNGKGVWYQDYGKRLDNTLHKYRGNVSSCILLYDVEYIEISNIAMTNEGHYGSGEVYNSLTRYDRTGVAGIAENIGTVDHIYLRNLDVRNVEGHVRNKHMANGGIYLLCHKPDNEAATGVSKFDDVLIEGCRLDEVNRWGIAVGYTAYWDKFVYGPTIDPDICRTYGSTNVVIRGNYLTNIGGDGITTMYCYQPVMEYNVLDGYCQDMTDEIYGPSDGQLVGAGIWPWMCKTAILQYNEAYNSTPNPDGQAWDADWGDNAIYQYNYSCNNAGGAVMFCGQYACNTVFRYNISQNDLAGVLNLASSPNGEIYNNVFYIKEGVKVNRTGMSGGRGNTISNNIFYYAGNTPASSAYGNWNEITAEWRNNIYYNFETIPADDFAITADPLFVDPGKGPTGAHESGLVHDISAFEGYKLRENSPAIDAGTPINDNGGLDFFGNELDLMPDIGAYDAGTFEADVERIQVINVDLGETVTITDSTGDYADATPVVDDEKIASVSLSSKDEVSQTTVSALAATSLKADTPYMICNANTGSALTNVQVDAPAWGTRALRLSSDKTLSDENTWTLEADGTGYKFRSADGSYLSIDLNASSLGEGDTFTAGTYGGSDVWTFRNAGGYYLDNLGRLDFLGGWTEVGNSSTWKLYEIITSTLAGVTELTFTGLYPGTTNIVIGDTLFMVRVSGKLQEVALKPGETATFNDESGNYTGADTSALDESVATVELSGLVTSNYTLGSKVTSLANGKYILVNTRAGKPVTNDPTTHNTATGLALTGTKEQPTNASIWTLTGSGSSYTVQDQEGKYLTVGSDYAAVTDTSATLSLSYRGSTWTISQNSAYLNDFGGAGSCAAGWVDWSAASDSGSQWDIYTATAATLENGTTITFTGVGGGETHVRIGDTMYHIVVEGDGHGFVNGFCDHCDEYQSAKLVNGIYEIGNAGQLYWFAELVDGGELDADAVLTADITVNADGEERRWNAIGSNAKKYSGTFDGQGYTISGLFYENDATTGGYIGLVATLAEDGVVKNVTVADSEIVGYRFIGAIAGQNNGTIINCHNDGSVIMGSGSSIGGIAGGNAGTVSGCSSSGDISSDAGNNIGGIVGQNTGLVELSFNTGDVISDCCSDEHCVGGIVGENVSGTVRNCYNAGSVENKGAASGGIVGKSDRGTVDNCHNVGDVSGKKDAAAVIGKTYNNPTVNNCYYLADAETDALEGTTAKNAAAFAGGEVLALLNAAGEIWEQGAEYPVLSGSEQPHEHDWSDWTVTTPATCTADGVETRTCECGESETRAIAALGHTEETIPAVAATCTETGLTEGKKCSVCGETLVAQEVIPALGHKAADAVKENEVAATCTTAGSYDSVVYCSVCNAEISRETVTVAALGHTEETVPAVAATCTETGLTEGVICSVCNEVLVAQEVVEALGHAWKGIECERCDATRENPFTDVPNDSFCIDAVLWAVENGITEGTSDTTFNPGGACQRAVVVTFLWRAAGSPEPTTTENPFTDVKENAFYYKAVLWAVEKGITTGTSETTFDPGALCNRATVVTFLYRALGEPEVSTTENPFTDVKADSWYGPAVLWAVENGVTEGVGNGLFAPGTNCNRAQVVTFLHRAMA